MTSSARNSYLETEVLTAPPQKLQLMLIEAAIRFDGQRGTSGKPATTRACETLIRAQQIVTELLAGLNHEVAAALSPKGGLRLPVRLPRPGRSQPAPRPAEARRVLRVLEVERETWRQVCEQLGTGGGPAAGSPYHRSDRRSPARPAPTSMPGAAACAEA